jgi:drug/metabolite transporter (DMT)-like permease
MTWLATFVLIGNLIFDTTGHLAFKGASARAAHLDGLAHWKALATSPWLWVGLIAFVGEFFMWLAVLSLVPLAQGVLVGCINIAGVMIGGRLLFGEALTVPRLVAVALVVIGVLLVGWGGA